LVKHAGTDAVYQGVDRRSEGTMADDTVHRSDLAALARDPLVRLVMASDGVTEAEFVAVLRSAQLAVQSRMVTAGNCDVTPRRRRPGLRAVPAYAGRCAGL
jgi:hypothetical protein